MSYVSRAGPEPRPERLTHVLDRNALEVRIVRETPITSESDPERRSTVKPLRRRVPGGETDGCDGPGPDGRRTSPRTASGLPWKRKRVSYSGSPSGLAWTQRTDSPRDSPSMCANALCEVHSRSDGPGSATPIPCLDRSWDRPAHRPSRPVSTGSQTYPLQIPTLVAIERSIADPARFCIAVGDLRRRRDSPLRRDSIARIRGRDGRYDVFWGHYSSLVGIPTTTAVRATCPAPVGVGGDADFVRLMPATGESPVYERVRPREVR